MYIANICGSLYSVKKKIHAKSIMHTIPLSTAQTMKSEDETTEYQKPHGKNSGDNSNLHQPKAGYATAASKMGFPSFVVEPAQSNPTTLPQGSFSSFLELLEKVDGYSF